MIKAVFPSGIGHEEIVFSKESAVIAASCGFSGYWFDPHKDFNLSALETCQILKDSGLVPAGMELPVEFRLDEWTFSRDLERLSGVAKYAASIGIKRAVTWIVPAHDTLSYEENFQLHVERLQRILDVLAPHDIVLGLEFQGPKSLRKGKKNWFVHSLDGMKALIAAIDRPNVGLVIDVWHWDLAGEESFDFAAIKDKREIVAVHINDAPENTADEDYQDLVRRLPGATGILHIETFVNALRNLAYDGPVVAEPFEAMLAKMSYLDALETVSDAMDRVL